MIRLEIGEIMIKNRIQGLLSGLSQNLYEREVAMNFSFLSSVAGESIFLLGPPGVAKSLIARRLKFAYQEGKAFEYLMSRFSTPDEIFGPVSIKQLKDDDRYTRLTDNYLPGSNIVFLDEIWKAGPAIQNSLLTVINEKIYRNGEEELYVNLKGLISASNELPAKGEGLEALWDRFIIRLYVGGIKDKDVFNQMIVNITDQYVDTIPAEMKITDEEYAAWTKQIETIKIGASILELIDAIRKKLVERNEEQPPEMQIIVSDRRWKKIIHLLRTSAFLNDQTEVDLIDCFIIPYCIWNHHDQIDEMKQFTEDLIRDRGYVPEIDPTHIKQEISGLKLEIKNETDHTKKITKKVPVLYEKEYHKLINYPKKLFAGDDHYYSSRDSYEYYILKKDFASLKNDEMKEIEVYTKRYDYIEEFGEYDFRLIADVDLMILNNKTESRLSLESKDKEQVVDSIKPPHPALRKAWNKSVEKIIDECDAINKEIDGYKENKSDDLNTHLFFGPEYGEIVLTNLEETINSINKLKIEVEQTRYYYENIKGNGS